jgi:hypothetical protein
MKFGAVLWVVEDKDIVENKIGYNHTKQIVEMVKLKFVNNIKKSGMASKENGVGIIFKETLDIRPEVIELLLKFTSLRDCITRDRNKKMLRSGIAK